MHPIRRLLVVMGTLAAAMTLVPVTSAGAQHPFHLDKTCAADPSEPLGFFCTVEHSDFKWIPAGTDIRYLSQNGNVVHATIEIRNGSTDGSCTWSSDVDAICAFGNGTGRLTQFNMEIVVTASPDQSIWYWDGAYWFGN